MSCRFVNERLIDKIVFTSDFENDYIRRISTFLRSLCSYVYDDYSKTLSNSYDLKKYFLSFSPTSGTSSINYDLITKDCIRSWKFAFKP